MIIGTVAAGGIVGIVSMLVALFLGTGLVTALLLYMALGTATAVAICIARLMCASVRRAIGLGPAGQMPSGYRN